MGSVRTAETGHGLALNAWSHVAIWPGENDYCWLWTGPVEGSGRYGRTQGQQAHRLIYQRVFGPIPQGLVGDHLCMNKLCVRPDHIEPVTMGVNTSRARASRS